MKKKILLSPLIIIIFIVLAGVSIAGAAIFIGNTTGDSNSLGVNLQKGLVGQWKLDGNANDSTPNRNHGTVAGATLTADRKDQSNKAYSFDGTDYINLGTSPTVLPDAFTVTAWVKYSGAGSAVPLLGFTTGFETPALYLEYTGGLNLPLIYMGGSNYRYFTRTTNFWDNTWHFIVFTMPGNSQTSISSSAMYVDTVSQAASTTSATGGQGTKSNAYIGLAGNKRGLGSYDDVRIYNRVLSASEITALYQEYNPGIQVSDLQKGLAGQWKMDGNANDSTTYRNHGTVTGATLTTDRKGQVNKAYSFNGTTDYITLANESNFDYERTQALSISVWIKATTQAITQGVVTKINPNSPFDGWALVIGGTDGKINFGETNDNTTNKLAVSATDVFPTGSWKHFVVTYDGSSTPGGIKMYIDGIAVGMTTTADTLSASILSNQIPTIGSYAGTNRFLNGSLDDVRIYNRVLSATEITALYQEYSPGIQVSDLQKGLVGNWNMNGNANDSTTYRNHGTVTGAALANDRKGQANKAYLFDGIASTGIKMVDAAALDTPPITFSFWAQPNRASMDNDYRMLLDKANASIGTNLGYYIFFDDRDSASMVNSFRVLWHRTGSPEWTESNFFTSDAWTHIVIVIDHTAANTVNVYKDGTLVTADTVVNGSGSHTKSILGLAIGERVTAEDHNFNGSIDDVRIYNRALTATEITQLYESY